MALTWADTYKPVVYQWFRTGMDSIPSLIPLLFDVRTSNAASEYALGVGGVPTDQFDIYEDAGRVANVDVDRYYPTTFTHVEKPIRFTLKRKDVDDDQMGLVQEALDQLGLAAAMKREQDAASVFNNAFSSSFTGADGVSLCNASHPYGPDNTGEVQDNTGTEALSYTAMKNARLNMRSWVDSQNNPLPRVGTMMLIPPELEDTAMEITGADRKPGTADNDASATQGFSYTVWDYMTDANNWFMLDMNYTRRFLRWYNRKKLEMEIVEQTTTHVIYEFYMRYSYGWVDWRFVYGNEVT
jgi:phage major head subunit gpT-like protein